MQTTLVSIACSLLMLWSVKAQEPRQAFMVSGASTGGNKDGAAKEARYDAPRGLAISAGGVLLVADSGNSRIRSLQAQQVTTYAGSGVFGQQDSQSAHTATFGHPDCVLHLRDRSVLVGDGGRVRIVRPNGSVATWLNLSTTGKPAHVTSLASAADGTTYVCDRMNHRIYSRFPDGRVSLLCTTERSPYSIAVHPNGKLLVGEYERILTVTSDGRISVFHKADKAREEPLSDVIHAMAFDTRGRLFVADGYCGLLMIKEGSRARPLVRSESGVQGVELSLDGKSALFTRDNAIWQIALPQ